MRLKQSNKLVMYESVISYLKQNTGVVSLIAKFTQVFAEFENEVANIKQKEIERQSVTAGKTESKYSAEDELIDIAVKVAAGLFSYSRRASKADVKELADVNHSKLDKLKDSDLVSRCRQIYDAAKLVETELIEYGIKAEDINELKSAADIFEESLGGRDASVAQRISALATLKELFIRADDILENDLDKFADQFKKNNPEFYKGYYAARSIKDIGIRHEDKKAPEPA